MSKFTFAGILLATLVLFSGLAPRAFDVSTRGDEPSAPPADAKPAKKVLAKDPPGMKRLLPDSNLWIDPKNKRVVFDGVVCMRQGPLEMFACLKGTKEYESVVSVDTRAQAVHAGLLAIGAKAGSPVQFVPKYKAANGSEIDVTVIWEDDKKVVHHDRAADWVRNNRTKKALDFPWVFAGSLIVSDEDSGAQHYLAEQGDFICVSNFPSAMLDLPVESSQMNSELMFEAFTDHIPPVGTPVRVVLSVKPEKQTAKTKPAATETK